MVDSGDVGDNMDVIEASHEVEEGKDEFDNLSTGGRTTWHRMS